MVAIVIATTTDEGIAAELTPSGTQFSSTTKSVVVDEEDTTSIFKILVITDSHLGHKEKDRVRGLDSFRSFEECLQIGDRLNADFNHSHGRFIRFAKAVPRD